MRLKGISDQGFQRLAVNDKKLKSMVRKSGVELGELAIRAVVESLYDIQYGYADLLENIETSPDLLTLLSETIINTISEGLPSNITSQDY